MVVNCQTYLELVVAVQGHVFHGLSSLVDVGGGHGTSMEVISREFPHIKCTVLDLPHVISQAPAGNGKVQFIAGDMFKSIPPADAVVLKVSLGFNIKCCRNKISRFRNFGKIMNALKNSKSEQFVIEFIFLKRKVHNFWAQDQHLAST